MTTRDELVMALAGRYALGSRVERGHMLAEFAALTGNHRKQKTIRMSGVLASPNSLPLVVLPLCRRGHPRHPDALELGSIKRLMYPAEADNVASVRRNAVTADVGLSNFLKHYAAPNGIAGEIDMAAHWAADYHVPLVVTEFGVYNSVAPPVSRANWMRDVRRTLEARGIGSTVWEYRGGFGIDADLRRMCGGEASIRSAFGLCKTMVD